MTKNGPTTLEVKIYPRCRMSYKRKKIKVKTPRTPWPLPWKPLCHKKRLQTYDIA